LYDASAFAKKHPGGNVIMYALHKEGADATDVFNEFHYRSKKAQMVLRSLPHKPAGEMKPKPDDPMLADFRVFRKQLVDDGFFEPRPLHVAYRFVEVAVMFVCAMWLISQGWMVLGLTIIGLFGGRCGWIQHEGGHKSLTGSMWTDMRIQAFFIGFGLSSSGAMWNAMHEKHHATPQKIKHDLDIDTTPLVAFFNEALTKNRNAGAPYSALWMKFQAFTFIPITSGVIVMLFWLFYLHPRKVIRSANYEEGVWMLSSHIITTALISHLGDMSVGAAYLAFWYTRWIAGMYLFVNFSLSHTHCDTVEHDEHVNWVEYAVHHTVDIVPGNTMVDWWMGYLNCQVIHHLFPSMPQCNQPEVSKRFEVFCKKWDLRYQNVSYFEAWRLMLQNLQDVGHHINSPEGKVEIAEKRTKMKVEKALKKSR